MTYEDKQNTLRKKYLNAYDSKLYDIDYLIDYQLDGIRYTEKRIRNYKLEELLFHNAFILNLSMDFLSLLYDNDVTCFLKEKDEVFDICLEVFKTLDNKKIYNKNIIDNLVFVFKNKNREAFKVITDYKKLLEYFSDYLNFEISKELSNLFFSYAGKSSIEDTTNIFYLLKKVLLLSSKLDYQISQEFIVIIFVNLITTNRSSILLDYIKKSEFTDLELINVLKLIVFNSDSIVCNDIKSLSENALYLNKEFKNELIADLLYNLYEIDVQTASILTRVFSEFLDFLLDKNLSLKEKKYIEDLRLIDDILHIEFLSSKKREQFYLRVENVLKNKENLFKWYQELTLTIKNLYTRLYNENILNPSLKRSVRLVNEVGGVKVYETTDDFHAIIHSVSRKNLNIDSLDDYECHNLESQADTFVSDWNERNKTNKKVSLTSIHRRSINSVINPDDDVYVGFKSFDFLDTMSPGDAYSGTFNELNVNNFFIPPEMLESESRYGYNELCVTINKPPDYIFIRDNRFSKGMIRKLARLQMPIVICRKSDYYEKNYQELEELASKCLNLSNNYHDIYEFINLFCIMTTNSLSESNKKLLNFLDEWSPRFFRNLFSNTYNIKDKIKIYNTILIAYLEEKRKYNNVKNIKAYGNSVRSFILDDSVFIKLFRTYFNNFNYKYFDITDNFSLIYFLDDEMLEEYISYNNGNILNMTDLEIIDKITINLENYSIHKELVYYLIGRCIEIRNKVKIIVDEKRRPK